MIVIYSELVNSLQKQTNEYWNCEASAFSTPFRMADTCSKPGSVDQRTRALGKKQFTEVLWLLNYLSLNQQVLYCRINEVYMTYAI